MALFTMDGMFFIFRWFHFFFGITWIGLLYYFNFVQGPFFNETDASTKSNAIQKLVPRALFWFRWSAMVTFITGWLIIGGKGHTLGSAFLTSSWGVSILAGGIIGSFMWANVWFIIWPNQKTVIQSATQAASGGTALPNAAACAAKAGLASRHNVLYSIPMLFLMGAASHLGVAMDETSNVMGFFGVFALIMIALQFNAMKGKMGPLTSVKGVIHCGFALALAFYFLMEGML
jgi:uncharacterized membrane protein